MSERIGWIYGLYLEGEPDRVRYIGQTVSRRGVAYRVYHHKYNARTSGDGYPVYRWIRKHGEDAIRYRVLETTTQGQINEAEIRQIQEHRSRGLADLNILSGGEGVTSEEVSGEKNPRAKISKDEVMKIRQEAQQRYVSSAEVAQKYGVQFSAASKILRNYSWHDPEYDPETRIKPSDHAKDGDTGFAYRRLFSDRQVDEVRREYLSGTPSKELAQKYGIGRTSISRVLFREYGSDKLRQECVSRKSQMRSRKITPDQVREAVRRVEKGETRESIAKEYGVTPPTISYHVKRAKLD